MYIPSWSPRVRWLQGRVNQPATIVLLLLSCAGLAFSRQAQSDNELLREAAQSIQQREFGTAAELLRKVLTSDPESSPAYNLLGICQAQTGQYEGARKFFEKAIELDPNFATARVNLGNLLLGMHENAAAL